MGTPLLHIPVKLIVGLISSQPKSFALAERILHKKYGAPDRESRVLDFSSTKYYEKEFGTDLKKKFLSFKKLISLKESYKIKLFTNALERKLSHDKKRTVNIDPGYVTLTNLVLFTTKPRGHRIYIDRGIYAEVELFFEKKTFRPSGCAYPDFKTEEYIHFFNAERASYLAGVKNMSKHWVQNAH